MTRRAGVTIVIPTRNQELLLPRTIASALQAVALLCRQGIAGEVLVIDDHSRDGSLTLLRKLEALHFADGLRVLAFADQAGLVAGRNQALLIAHFPYVAYLDAGDELLPENLHLFVRTLQETGAAAAYGNLLIRMPSSRCAHSVMSNESMQAKIFSEDYVGSCAVFDRLQLLDVGGYQFDQDIGAAQELWMHLAANGRRMVFVPAVLGYHYLAPCEAARGEGESRPVKPDHAKRVFGPVRLRAALPLNTRHLRYHPEIGDL
jgi:succinoglycan biosynthesis protein ExoO